MSYLKPLRISSDRVCVFFGCQHRDFYNFESECFLAVELLTGSAICDDN